MHIPQTYRARKYVDSAIRWRNFLTVRWVVVPRCVITMANIVNILGVSVQKNRVKKKLLCSGLFNYGVEKSGTTILFFSGTLVAKTAERSVVSCCPQKAVSIHITRMKKKYWIQYLPIFFFSYGNFLKANTF